MIFSEVVEVTPETLSVDEVSLQEKFFQQFAKTKPIFLTTLIDYDGNIYHVDSNDYQLGKKIKSNWDNNTKDDYYSGKGIWKKDEKGKITLLKERLKNYITNNPLNVFSNNIKFLNLIGVKFSTSTFTKEEQEIIKNATNKIYKYILDNPDVNDIFNSNVVNTEINNLVNIESNYTKDQIELQHINAENKTIYGITLNNYLSLITNDINNGNTPNHLLEKNNPYVKNSYWLQKIREGKKIEVAINEGYKINEQGEEGEVISAASPSNLYLSHINSILNGVFPFLQNADRKLSYAVKTDITFGNDDFNHILQGYIYDELIRIAELHKKNGIGTNIENYKDDGKKFTIFFDFPFDKSFFEEASQLKNIKQINEFLEKHNEEINRVFNKYFADKTTELLQELKKYHLILDDVNNKFTISGIDKTKVNELLGTTKENYTKSDLELVASHIYKNQFVAYVEQSKIFTGDLALFKDPFKRFSMISGTKKISDTRPILDNWLNKNFIRKDKKQADGTYNVLLSHDVLGNVNVDYIEILKGFGLSDADINKYTKYEETDGQGWITLDEHREFLMRNGDLPIGYQEAWGKAQRGEELSNTELMFFMPIKPQAYTPKVGTGLYDATGIKCSFCPLIPSMIKNTIGLKDMLKYMTDNKIGVHVVASVEKFGGTLIDGKIPEFYDENGKFNTKNKNIQTFPYKYLGIQLDIAPIEKDKVTFGTQFRKLLMTNLFAFGKSKLIRVLRNGKLEGVDTQELFDKYENSISRLTEIKRNQLKKELSLEKDGDKWKIKNFDKLKDFILNAALDRNSADNVIESIKLALNSDNKAIDATSMKNKIENLLSSIINNDVISQKMFGDMKVMGTSSGWETKPRVVNGEYKGVKKWLPSNETLKFYTDENGGVSKMEIYLPDIYRSKFGDINGFTIGSKLDKIDKRLLEVIGFRIPTQGFNSMESIIIKGFLPKEAGNLVVVPSELVVKAGIDFDVDKMNILYPSVFKVGNRLFYLHEDNIVNIFTAIQDKINKSFTTESKNEITQQELEYSKMSLDEFVNEFTEDNEEGFLKNQILETSKEILSSPEVAKELLKPNGTHTLKEIVNRIRSITQSGRGEKPTNSKVVDLMHNIKVAIALWSGKDGVGATALHNTTHVLAQKAGLYINEDTSIGLKHNEVEDKPGLISLSGEYTYDGKHKITDIINEFLSAYVDVAKDDIVFDLNAGMQTVNIWMYLLRAGCSPNEVAYFMRQPIIIKYVIAQQINESIPTKLAGKELSKTKLIKKVIENIYEEFKGNPVKVEKLKISDNIFEEETLEHNIKKPLGDKDDRKENPQFIRDQLHYLEEFLKYQDDAKKLSDLINASKFDTIGVDKNRGANRQRIKNLNKIINDGFFGNIDKYLNDSVIKEFYKTAQESVGYYNDLFITDSEKARRVLNQIDDILDKREINSTTKAELMDIAENEFISYLLQNIPFDKIALGQEIERLTTGVNSIAKQFKRVVEKYMNDEKAKNNSDHFINNPFIKELQWILNNKNKDKDFLKLFSRKYNTYQANQLREGFLKLFEISPKLAEDIMKLGIIQSGLNNSPISFMSIIPAEKYFELANRIITKYKNSNEFDYNKFISLFFNNNRGNSKLVPVITSRMKFRGWSVRISNDYTKLTMDLNKVSPNFANALYVRNLVKNPEFEKKNEQETAELKAQGKEKFIEMIYKQSDVPGVYVRTQQRGDGMWYHDYFQNEEFIEKPFSDEALDNFNSEEEDNLNNPSKETEQVKDINDNDKLYSNIQIFDKSQNSNFDSSDLKNDDLALMLFNQALGLDLKSVNELTWDNIKENIFSEDENGKLQVKNLAFVGGRMLSTHKPTLNDFINQRGLFPEFKVFIGESVIYPNVYETLEQNEIIKKAVFENLFNLSGAFEQVKKELNSKSPDTFIIETPKGKFTFPKRFASGFFNIASKAELLLKENQSTYIQDYLSNKKKSENVSKNNKVIKPIITKTLSLKDTIVQNAIGLIGNNIIENAIKNNTSIKIQVFSNAEYSEDGVAGWYLPASNTIYIHESMLKQEHILEGLTLISHELIHSVTEQSLRYDKQFQNEIQSLLDNIKNQSKIKNLYGFKNTSEFLSEAFSSEEFRTLLKNTQFSNTEKLSIWQKFVNVILKLFNKNQKYSEKTISQTAEQKLNSIINQQSYKIGYVKSNITDKINSNEKLFSKTEDRQYGITKEDGSEITEKDIENDKLDLYENLDVFSIGEFSEQDAIDIINKAFSKINSDEDAKKLYRSFALTYHPDKKGSETVMKHLNNVIDNYRKYKSKPKVNTTTNSNTYSRWKDSESSFDKKIKEKISKYSSMHYDGTWSNENAEKLTIDDIIYAINNSTGSGFFDESFTLATYLRFVEDNPNLFDSEQKELINVIRNNPATYNALYNQGLGNLKYIKIKWNDNLLTPLNKTVGGRIGISPRYEQLFLKGINKEVLISDIYLNPDLFTEESLKQNFGTKSFKLFTDTIGHELIHKLTIGEILKGGQFRNNINSIYKVAFEYFKNNPTNNHSINYGMSDLAEFTAEFFSSYEFRDYLNKIKTKEDTTKSLLDKIITAIVRLFNKNYKFSEVTVKDLLNRTLKYQLNSPLNESLISDKNSTVLSKANFDYKANFNSQSLTPKQQLQQKLNDSKDYPIGWYKWEEENKPKKDYTRLYRAENEKGVDNPAPDWVKENPQVKESQEASGRWFYKTLEEAKYHSEKFGGNITYVDVPTSEVEKYNARENKFAGGYGKQGNEYFVSKEISKQRKELQSNKQGNFIPIETPTLTKNSSSDISKNSIIENINNALTLLNEDKTLSLKEKNSKIKALRELKNIVENKKNLTEKDLGEIRRKYCNLI